MVRNGGWRSQRESVNELRDLLRRALEIVDTIGAPAVAGAYIDMALNLIGDSPAESPEPT